MRANWNTAVTSWKTIPAKNGQNAPRKTMLYNCNTIAALPRIPNRYKTNRVARLVFYLRQIQANKDLRHHNGE